MYGLAIFFEIANAAGILIRVSDPVAVHLGPIAFENLRVEATPLGLVVGFGIIAAAVASYNNIQVLVITL